MCLLRCVSGLCSSLLKQATHIFNSGAGLAELLSNVTPGLRPGVRTPDPLGPPPWRLGPTKAGT